MKTILNLHIIDRFFALAMVFCSVSFISSCEKDNGLYRTDFVPAYIVDGHIEQFGYPRVILTRNISYYAAIDSSDIINLILRQAKVIVSDGVNSEILTLKYNKQVFPPYYYEGTDLTGEAGKTYLLTIIYGKDTLFSQTTIPKPVKPDSVWFESEPGKAGKGKICVKIKDDPGEQNYYKFFTQIKNKQNSFYPTLISNFSDQTFNGQTMTFRLLNGPETYLSLTQKDFYYSTSDTIWLKLCTMDKEHYNFWSSYQLEVANGANPFSSSFHTVASNIHGNGLGIWGGYGVTVRRITAK